MQTALAADGLQRTGSVNIQVCIYNYCNVMPFHSLGTCAQLPKLWNNTGMTSTERHIQVLLRRAGTVRSRDFVAAGITRSQLSRMAAAGQLVRVARGLYAMHGYQSGEHGALVAVVKRARRGVLPAHGSAHTRSDDAGAVRGLDRHRQQGSFATAGLSAVAHGAFLRCCAGSRGGDTPGRWRESASH